MVEHSGCFNSNPIAYSDKDFTNKDNPLFFNSCTMTCLFMGMLQGRELDLYHAIPALYLTELHMICPNLQTSGLLCFSAVCL